MEHEAGQRSVMQTYEVPGGRSSSRAGQRRRAVQAKEHSMIHQPGNRTKPRLAPSRFTTRVGPAPMPQAYRIQHRLSWSVLPPSPQPVRGMGDAGVAGNQATRASPIPRGTLLIHH